MLVVTVLLGGAKQAPVTVLVWHRVMLRDRLTVPVSALTVVVPVAPTFTLATAKKPVPVVPGICTMPSFVVVAPKATMSGIGVADAESNNELSPVSYD